MNLAFGFRSLLLATAFLFASSCSQLGQLSDVLAPYTPKISFNKMALKHIDFQAIDVDFKFNVKNPNPVSVKLAQFGYALGLQGVEFLNGRNTDGFKLESRGTSELAIPVGLKYADIYRLVRNTNGKDSIAYNLTGDFGFNTPVGLAKVPFKQAGDFPVVRPPKISIKNAKVGTFDILKNKASLSVDLGFGNPKGGKAISFDAFDYKLKLAGKPIANGVMKAVTGVAGAKEKTVTLPIDLNLLQLGSSVVSLIQGKSATNIALDGTLKVGTPFGSIPLNVNELASFILK